MKPWQPIYTDLKQKPRGEVSTVMLLSSLSLVKGLCTQHHNSDLQKGTPVFFSEDIKLVKKSNAAQWFGHPDIFYSKHDAQ